MNQEPYKEVVIDLIFNPQCPYLDEARNLTNKLKSDIPSHLTVREWDVSNPSTPENFKKHQLPAFFVNNTFLNPEIEGLCRCHRPHKKLISYNALKNNVEVARCGRNSWYTSLANFPTVLLSLLPFSGCPCSFIAATACISSLALFWARAFLLSPLLTITLFCLYIMTTKSGRVTFFVSGLISGAVFSLGTWYHIDIMARLGVMGLVGISLFSAFYKKRFKQKKACD